MVARPVRLQLVSSGSRLVAARGDLRTGKENSEEGLSQLPDENGSPLGRQGPPPALAAMGTKSVDWFLFTHNILSRRSSAPISSDGPLCPLCATSSLSRDHIVSECVAAEVTRARQITKESSHRAWDWIEYPPHSLTSPWASSRVSQRAAATASEKGGVDEIAVHRGTTRSSHHPPRAVPPTTIHYTPDRTSSLGPLRVPAGTGPADQPKRFGRTMLGAGDL